MSKQEVYERYSSKCDEVFTMMFFNTLNTKLTYREYKDKHFNGDVSLMAKKIKESRPKND